MTENLVNPWLVSIWPGMGSVALNAGNYLREQLGAQHLFDMPAREFFDIEKVEINEGVARVGWLPSCSFYGWKNPQAGFDLLIFIGEAQPSQRGYEFCGELLKIAARFGVRRLFTFAAMATQIHPRGQPRVFTVSNEKSLLPELQQQSVDLLEEGQISGLNGVLLAAAAERNLEAICLLGEMPFFAVSVPNPKASLGVLEVFAAMAHLNLDFSPLQTQSKEVEQRLVELIDRMNIAVGDSATGDSATGDSAVGDSAIEASEESFEAPEFSADPPELKLSAHDHHLIEDLFNQAQQDRAKAIELKQMLDRLGVFTEYEDRFLDLFKRGE
ncbi:MAG: PAC2 family protein [Planctomycetota bacterium]